MDWIKSWLKPAIMIMVWITVLSYTVSMLATVEPTLRRLGPKAGQADASVDPRM
jgi:hypothetical protein